jgi:hypothetical protein
MAERSSTRTFEHTLPGVGNRRTLERYPLHTEIFIWPLDDRFPARWVMSEDITHRGIFIRSGSGYPLDTIIELTIHTLHGDIHVTGKVVHRIRGVGFGCRFMDLSDRSRADLSFMVSQYYAAPHPRRKIN